MTPKYPYTEKWPFVAVLLLYQAFLALMVGMYGYKGSFLIINGLHAGWLDAPVFLLTHLGDALILTSLLGLLFVRKHPDVVLLMVVVVILTGLFGQLLKNTLFDMWDRPLRVFGEDSSVHIMYHYRLFHNSFPSGHSITVAAAFTALVMSVGFQKYQQVLLALLVAAVSYSRIYVSAHFPGDVLAGTVLGVAGALILTAWLRPLLQSWLKQWPNPALRRLKIILTVAGLAGMIGGCWMISEYLMQM